MSLTRVWAHARRSLNEPLNAVPAIMALIPWLVAPGVIEPDTKIDLVISPWRYLGRALDAWSTHSGFGELQNQAYGYLFPMGPFFGVLHSCGMPGWAIQRAWWSLLILVGYLGAKRAGQCIWGVSAPAAALAGVAYALSPRVLTLLSELSVEAWPGMLLPWLVLGVHRAQRDGRIVRLVVTTGLLGACLGGVNATASLVAVLGGGLFALTSSGVRPRWRVISAYGLGAALGCAWWIGPLVVLGGYAYPFMDYIETSHITTAVTTLPAILRGASDWVAYIVDAGGHPVWQSGWVVAQSSISIIAATALAGVGLVGLVWLHRASRASGGHTDPRHCATVPGETSSGSSPIPVRAPGIAPLGLLLGVGVVAMAAGYAGTVSGPQSGAVRGLLDGPLAAARNVHKFDPLVRLPIVIGLGVAFNTVRFGRSGTPDIDRRAGQRRVVGFGIVALLVASMTPLMMGRLADPGGIVAWPDSVKTTAEALDADAQVRGGSSLVLPSTRTVDATWGAPGDEPLSAFARSPIAVRASAPLYHPGAVRLVDTLDTDLASSHEVTASLDAAARAGIRRIVIRWGLSSATQANPPQAYVAALSGNPRVIVHRTYGSGASRYDVFELTPTTATTGPLIPVLGGPGSTVTLAAAGIDPRRALAVGTAGGWITDDERWRVYNNGRPSALAFGPTLSADDRAPEALGSRELAFPGRNASLVTRSLSGADQITARTSTSSPFASLYLGPGTSPSAAFDTSAQTRWLTPIDDPSPLVVQWSRGSVAQRFTLTTASAGEARVDGVHATADGHALSVRRSQAAFTLDVPAGTRSLALLPLGEGDRTAGALGFSTVSSSRPISSVLTLPGRVDPAHSGVAMTKAISWGNGRALAGEDDGVWARSFTSAAGTMNVNVRVGSSAAGSPAPHLWWRHGAGAWEPLQLSGHSGRITWPGGQIELKASPEVEAIDLTPTDGHARAALGLPPAPSGSSSTSSGVTIASTQGANAGWMPASGSGRLVVLDGWRQGVIGGAAPRADVGTDGLVFAPQRAHRIALGFGATCIVVLLGLGLLDRRKLLVRRKVAMPHGRAAGPAGRLASSARVRPSPSTLTRVVAASLVAAASDIAVGWVAPLLLVAAWVVPRGARVRAVLALMVLTGPVMACFGVVAHGSLGASTGQLLTASALLLVSADLLDVPSAGTGVRRRAS